MLTLTYLRENTQEAVEGLQKRNFPMAKETIDAVLELDAQRKSTQAELDANLAEANALAREIGGLMKAGKKEEAELIKNKTSNLKQLTKEQENALREIEKELENQLVNIPNIPYQSVPAGKTAEDNVEVFIQGEMPTLFPNAVPHWDLIKKYDIIDFELGNKVSGAGFPFYKGKGARLQRALINFFLDRATAAGFVEVQPPIVINADSGFATGQLPDKEGQMYHATADDLFLIPTAEVPITNMYRDMIVSPEDLPLKNAGYTPCFRREAGSWGAHVRGLNRLHQFDKVEIVQVTLAEHSYVALDEMVEHVKALLTELELPFRILRLCGGDMGFTSALTYDFEVWSAAQERWLEVSSVSNFETYQSNRLKLRTKIDGKTQLLHTLNGSAMALPRIVAALLENNQREEGIVLPKILQEYCGFERID